MPACSGIRLAEPQFSRWHPQSCRGTPWLAGSSALDSLQQSPNSGSAPPALSSSSWGPHTQCHPPTNHKPSMHTFPSMTYIMSVCAQACLAELLLHMTRVSLESSGQQVTPYRLMPNTSDCRKTGGPCRCCSECVAIGSSNSCLGNISNNHQKEASSCKFQKERPSLQQTPNVFPQSTALVSVNAFARACSCAKH